MAATCFNCLVLFSIVLVDGGDDDDDVASVSADSNCIPSGNDFLIFFFLFFFFPFSLCFLCFSFVFLTLLFLGFCLFVSLSSCHSKANCRIYIDRKIDR